MDDRDKDLTGLFVRDLDEIPLPARAAWRGTRKENTAMRGSRMLLTVGALVAVLAIALIVGYQLNQRQQNAAAPSQSPTPSPSPAPVGVPSPSASACVGPCGPTGPASSGAVAIYNDDFGFVVTDLKTGPTIDPAVTSNIRKESSPASVGSFTHDGYWVSPDGTQIAYWTAKSASEPSQQLRIVRAANPQSIVASSGLSPNEDGGSIVWANDSNAVAYLIIGPAPATTNTIRTFNIQPGSSGPGQVVFTFTEAGKSIGPIAWDRATNMLAVAVYGGGFVTDYILADSATPGANAKRTPLSGKITSLTGSSDAKLILAIDAVAGPSYWPLASIGSRVTPTGAKSPAVWRPGTHEFGWVDADKLVLYSADQNATTGGFSGVPAGASIRTFRADGNAVLLAVPGGAQTTYTLVLLGKRDPSPGDRVTFQASDAVRQSVRLR